MEAYLKQIQQFLLSGQNIFNSSPLDYPTNWQQQFILSYFSMKQTLQKSHTQIIRQLNTQSPQQSQQIAQGCLYMLLLDKGNAERLSEYLMILRIDVWVMIAQEFIVLLSQYSDGVKLCYMLNASIIVDKLLFYGLCSPFLISLIANFVNYYDRSPEMQAVTKSILQLFIEKIQSGAELTKQVRVSICLYLLPKVLRINPHVEQKLCTKLVNLLFTKFPQCNLSSKQLRYLIETEPKCTELPHIYEIYRKVKENDQNGVNLREEEEIIFSYLPRRAQIVLQFIFKQNIKGNQLRYQLTWLEKSWYNKKYNSMEIFADIGRWAAYSAEFIQQRIFVLEWVCRKTISLPYAWDKVKRSIFNNWLVQEPQYSFERALTSLLLLRHFLATDARLGVDILKYLLKFQSEYRGRFKQILQTAIKLNHFSMEFILDNGLVPKSIQQDFLEILQPPKKPISAALQFHPDSPIKSDEEQNLNYNTSSHEELPIIGSTLMSDKVGEIFIDEQYVEQFTKLEDLLDQPNYKNFIEFFKQFIEIAEQARSSNKGFIETLVKQTARILYCAYNIQFESLDQQIPPDRSIINYIISMLLKSWHQVTHKIILIKNLVKKMFQLFPTSEVSFWFYFFTQFQYGGLNYREFKNWLIPKEKSEFVIKAVEIIGGKVDEKFRKKVNLALERKS